MVMASDPNTSSHTGLVNGSNGDHTAGGNPYETNPESIPKDDPFLKRHAQYGRYAPRDGDFKPRYAEWWQSDSNALAYWEEVVKSSCTPENSLNVPGPREVFASGSVVIRVDRKGEVGDAGDKYSFVNANELSTARKAEEPLKELGIVVPVIHFCGTVDGKNVTVESRVPGVSLEVAWRYLNADQIASIKEQCRRAFSCLADIDSNPERPSYVCKGLNSQSPPAVEEAERDILFQEKREEETLCLVHNNMTLSNVIVNDDRVVGISGWRQSGYFGFDRANKTHRQFRMQEGATADDVLKGKQKWADIYENIPNTGERNGILLSKDAPVPQVKTEPLSMNLDKVPLEDMDSKSPLAQLDGTEDYPTPRNVANLKHGGSRASSSDRSSPANSIKPSSGRKSTPVGAKKPPAKKPAAKKRKINDDDNESVDGGRSHTPSSVRASKISGVKKQSSVSRANSPAAEPKKKGLKRGKRKTVAEEDSEEEDEDRPYCICRKPDNHTWMIGCDGECEDWFHGRCVNIDPRDAELIDKYICPNCNEKGQGQTTWKPMCRLEGCRKPARFNQKNPSKYCSDDHGREFMRQRTKYLLKKNSQGEDLGSRGGVLTAGELKAIVSGVSSAQEFRKLGERIISPPPDEENPDTGEKTQKKLGLDADPDDLTYSADEASKIQKLRTRRDELLHRKEMLAVRATFLSLTEQRSKSILEKLKQLEPKGGWKGVCGFDSRLAWSDEEFDEWRLSEMGKQALKAGTPEALASSYPDATDADGDIAMDDPQTDENDIATITRGVCTKKRCERHKNWNKVHQSEILFEEETLAQDLVICEEEAQNVVERAVLRMWAEKDNAQMGILKTEAA